VLWFYVLVVAVVALSLSFYGNRRRTRISTGREHTLSETSTEIGAPAEARDREKALLSDRLAGVRRPQVEEAPREDSEEGAPKKLPLRKDNLSKEVELDWEASELIHEQPGAYALPRDFRDEPSKGFLKKTGELGALDRRRPAEEEYALPERYGKERLVLLARDPKWIYAYWEIARERYEELRDRRLQEWGLSRPVLRLYDLTEQSPAQKHLDVELEDEANNWYVRVDRPHHRFVAEIGRVFPDGFVSLVRSNEVSLPPDAPSMEIAEEWAPLDWENSYGRFTAKVGVSSPGTWVR
jgi:hypothetical protein